METKSAPAADLVLKHCAKCDSKTMMPVKAGFCSICATAVVEVVQETEDKKQEQLLDPITHPKPWALSVYKLEKMQAKATYDNGVTWDLRAWDPTHAKIKYDEIICDSKKRFDANVITYKKRFDESAATDKY